MNLGFEINDVVEDYIILFWLVSILGVVSFTWSLNKNGLSIGTSPLPMMAVDLPGGSEKEDHFMLILPKTYE